MSILDIWMLGTILLLILQQITIFYLIRRLENEEKYNIFIHNEHED